MAALAALFISSGAAFAQGVIQQFGTLTPGDAIMAVQNNLVMDAGNVGLPTTTGSRLNGLGIVNQNFGLCQWDSYGMVKASAYNQICFGFDGLGNALVAYSNVNTSPTGSLFFEVNGTKYQFPFSLNGIVGPASSVIGDLPTFNNVTGNLLADSGILASRIVQGPASSTVNDIAAYNNITGTLLADTNFPVSRLVQGPTSTTVNDLTIFNNSTGTLLGDSGVALARVVQGPTSSTTNDLAIFGNTTGNSVHDSNLQVSGNSFISDLFFKSGRPWIDVKAYGATGNGTTDDTAAVQAAINAAPGNGAIIYFPPGHYCVFGGITVPAQPAAGFSDWLLGASNQASLVDSCNHDVSTLTDNGNYSIVDNLLVYGRGSHPTDTFSITQPALILNCVGCRFEHDQFIGGSDVILVRGGGDIVLEDVVAYYGYGAIMKVTNAQVWLRRVKLDQGWPVATKCCNNQASFPAWASSHAYSSGDVVILNGYYIQASQAGTSGGAAPALLPYNATIADGSVHWLLVGPTGYYGLQVDTGSSQVTGEQVDLNGTFQYGLYMLNSASGQQPFLTEISASAFGLSLNSSVEAAAGYGLMLRGDTFAGCAFSGCSEIHLDSGWGGTANITGSIIYGGAYGISVSGGKNTNITGNNIVGATASLFFDSNVNNFIASSNFVGSDVNLGLAGTGIEVNTGTSDYYNLVNNICQGVTVTCYNDGGSGIHKTVGGNN